MNLPDYLRLPAVSSSTLWTLHYRSPWHARQDRPPTPAMTGGSLLHSLLLEPDEVEDRYFRQTLDGRTNDGRAQLAEARAAGLEIVKDADWQQIEDEADTASLFLVGLVAGCEQTLQWTEQGLDAKARPDLVIRKGNGYMPAGLADVKRVRNGHPAAFVAAMRTYGWHWQANWYLRAACALDLPADNWSWVVVENGGPSVVYTVTAAELDRFTGDVDAALETYRRCLETDTWPGYESGWLDLAYLASGPELDLDGMEVEAES